jgi:FHA domain/TIR domain
MPGRRIFISYRRGDTTIYAGRLHDSLCMRIGDEEVFMDLDAIEPGADFVEHIEREVGSCEVLIALIGRDWIDARDVDGQRRLEDPDDWVRLELEAGLNRDIRVIPVLVQGATMPRSDELPGDLAKLARRNALEIGDTRWRYDFDRLMEVIEKVLEGNSVPKAIELSGVRNFVPPPQPEPAGDVPLILVQEKPFPGKEHPLEDGLTLGRTDADVLLPDPQVSRRHAVLHLGEDGPTIEDLGSTNGTFVNDEQVNGPRRLEVGDLVRLGAVAFRLKPAPEGTRVAPRPQGSAGCA